MPDGHRRPVTMMKIHWNAYDYLMRATSFTEVLLADIALEEESETGRPFELCFSETVAYVRKLYAEHDDIYKAGNAAQHEGAIQVSDQDMEADTDAAHILRGTPPANPFWQGRA